MSANKAKLIAAITMLIDHTAVMLCNAGVIEVGDVVYTTMRMIGRLAFPIFCFMLAEGYEKTSNREQYLARLLLFAAFSQFPYSMLFGELNETVFQIRWDLVFGSFLSVIALTVAFQAQSVELVAAGILAGFIASLRISVSGYSVFSESLNVLYTMAFAIVTISGARRILEDEIGHTEAIQNVILIVAMVWLLWSFGMQCDYGFMGIIFPVALWVVRKDLIGQIIAMFLWPLATYAAMPQYMLPGMFCSVLPLVYNGERGQDILGKRFFYRFYPAHICVLGACGVVLKEVLGG